VRVDHDRVGSLGAGEGPAELLADRGRTGIGRVEVQPDIRTRTQVCDLRSGVNGSARGRPGGGDDRRGPVDLGRDCLGPQPEVVVDRKRPVGQADETSRLLDREVRLLGREHGPSRAQIARGGQRRDRRNRCRVLDVAVEAVWQPH
jgi:hypothetical protein